MLKAAEHESKTSDSIVIFANSSKRSSGITPSFTITLTRPITQFKSFEVLGLEVPFSFYNVWKGNVGIGEITDNGNLYTFNQGNLMASATVVESPNFLIGNSAFLMIKIDGNPYSIPFSYDPSIFVVVPVYTHIQYSINHANLGITCVISVVNYKLNFNLTTTSNFTKIGLYLNGTSFPLSSYLGLTQDTEVINLHPTNVADILMPSPYKIFNQLDYTYFTDYIYAYSDTIDDVNFAVQAQRQVNYYSSYSIRKNTLGVGLSDYDGTITIDPERHYISYILGFTAGNYSHLELAPNTIPTPIKPSKFYENRLLILLDYDINLIVYSVNVPDGYYTPTNLASYITSQLALITELSTSTVTASSAGYFTIIIQTQNPHSSIRFQIQKYYSWQYLIFKMGFEDQFVYVNSVDYKMEVTGVNITSATFIASKPFNYRPTHLYIRSATLAQLTNDSVSFIDDPTYQLDSIIHKVGINASPGGVITDDQKYQVKRYISHPLKSPLTQIDFSLYDEDGQLVQLNGRSWSIGIKIEF